MTEPSREQRRRELAETLAHARKEAEARFGELRATLDTELGLASPRRPRVWLLIGAGAVGLALAAGGLVIRNRSKRLG